MSIINNIRSIPREDRVDDRPLNFIRADRNEKVDNWEKKIINRIVRNINSRASQAKLVDSPVAIIDGVLNVFVAEIVLSPSVSASRILDLSISIRFKKTDSDVVLSWKVSPVTPELIGKYFTALKLYFVALLISIHTSSQKVSFGSAT